MVMELDESVNVLSALSEMTARPFGSTEEAIGAVLELIQNALGVRTPFLARTDTGQFEVIAVHEQNPNNLRIGDTLPLQDSY